MRVLVFTTQFYKLGGAERLAVELAQDLNKHGVHAEVLSMYSADLPGVAAARDALLSAGIPAVHFLGMRVHPSALSLPASLVKLRRLIEANAYDIVETSSISTSFLAAWATLGASVRHVAGIHEVFERERYRGMKHDAWRRSLRIGGRTRFYAISEYARAHWAAFSGIPLQRTRVIYNGISEPYFTATADRAALRKELGVSADSKLLLFVGRLMKRKGIDTLLEAVGPLLEGRNAHVLYIGEADDAPENVFPDEAGLLARMRATIAREGWHDRVHFLGRRGDVPRLMASADVLVHPARLEAFGLVLLEALAARLPVVASDVQGIPEVLAGTDSPLVAPDDPAALRAAVSKVLDWTPHQLRLAVEKGRMRAEQLRTARRTEAMIHLFKDVLVGSM
jgi:glycosyltransferase involved in cell wall biosynthesis